ncbi:uncharacterized protein LOC124556841 isoform X1 [Schistocerca americana]|uniref:uncharacterized protein LOC124556841 isoform X1 n=1 Tax=Schistocerca americana TaxID=7009 RepID=UPI001F4F3903|nr:uncharacterized protein LOC124556841 isoform X1 [Schistocerca americana]XP_047101924.1 uncharacterized protein LOC124721150 isoform X1 [Schistocerca piceifrons]XP_049953277.1 uncharacterized protein LOC126469924 isoform X1 [Schistocerca serialis cubense]
MEVVTSPSRLRDLCGRRTAPALAATGLSWQPNRSVTRRTARIAREVYSVWYGRVGSTNHVPSEKVQQLFNDMQLYPSKSQVYEMLQCAKECANRSSACYLTFGEFCIFATELKRCYERGIPRPVQLSRLLEKDGEDKKRRNRKMSKGIPKYEVFLGGSCNPTTWRQDTAIPMLKRLGITYYNPQVSHWGPELIELEYQAKQNATVLFFVIDNQTRSIASIIEAAHISGKRRKLILVIHTYQGPGQKIWGEPISEEEYDDLTTGQMMLQDLVERQGIPVFESIPIALNCTAKVLRDNISVQDLGLNDFAQPVKMAHVQLGDKLIKLKEAFDALDTDNTGEISLADVCMAFRILTDRKLCLSDIRNILATQTGLIGDDVKDVPLEQIKVNFEQFCAIVAEFKFCESEAQKLWDLVLAKTTRLLQAFVTSVVKLLEWAISSRPLRSLPLGAAANGQNSSVRDVYLGGSCHNTTWREDIAIPMLKKNGLTYHNPKVGQWSKRLIPLEAAAMDNSYVLLFIISNTSRSVAAMAVAAHYIGLGCNVVLCVQHLADDCVLGSDKLSKQAVKDYNRGRMYLSDLANREGVPVYDSIPESVECVIQKCNAR